MAVKGNYTERLAGYIANLKYADLPSDVVKQAKKVILDSLGCQVACSLLENGRLIVQFGRTLGGKREASVLGSNYKTTAINAVTVNGTLGHGDEIDESLEEVGHASAVMVPVALACGEKEHTSGKEMITAVVAGYEMAGRMANAGLGTSVLLGMSRVVSFTYQGVATACNALKLNTDQIRAAFGIASCNSGGYWDVGSEAKHMTKSFRHGAGARNGVTSALLARMGYDGPKSVFDGANNLLFACVGKEHDLEYLTKNLGKQFAISNTCFKLFSAGHPIHAPIFGLLKILDREGIKAEQIKSIVAHQPEFEQHAVDNRDMPPINLQYCMAVAAFDRQLTWDQYAPDRMKDPKVLELKSRIRSVHDPKMDERKKTTKAHSAEVELETKDGRRFVERVDYPPGDPGNPLTQKDIEKKAAFYAAKVLGPEGGRNLVQTVNNLEKINDVNKLGDLVRLPKGRRAASQKVTIAQLE